MTTPHAWKHGWADAYASRNGAIAEEFLDLVAVSYTHLTLPTKA